MHSSKAFSIVRGMLKANSSILEIGPGRGEHTRGFRDGGHHVSTVGPQGDVDVRSLWPYPAAIFFEGVFDCVWTSHVLEHAPDVGLFLRACFKALRSRSSILAVTVPPMKRELVGGHLSLWTPGLLVYRVVLAGFDCSSAIVFEDGYNVSLIVRKKVARLPALAHDAGDIKRLAKFFPGHVREGAEFRVPVGEGA